MLFRSVQNDFIDGALSNEVAKSRIPNIIKKINDFDGEHILITKDTHNEDYMSTSEGIHLPVPHCIKGTNGWEINKDVMFTIETKKIPYTIIEKPTFGSWQLTSFIDNFTKTCDNPIELNVIGFCTDICVISNVIMLKAALFDNPNVEIIVDSNCCAGVTEEKHNAALEVMKSCQINII